MKGWRQLAADEVAERAKECLGGAPVQTHILAQWVGQHGHDTPESELTLFEDGSVQLEGTASVEVVAHVLGAWAHHMRGKLAG